MIIPLKKAVHKTIPLREEAIISDKSYLIERAHIFNKQYVWAKVCAEVAYDMILKKVPQKTLKFKKTADEDVKGVILNVNSHNLLKTSGVITGLEDNGFVKIDINANSKITEKDKESAICEIQSAIVHELGHGNIYWKRYLNQQNINDIPDEYLFWRDVISSNDINPESALYKFCFACYSTYYQEVQAFISQTYGEILKIMQDFHIPKSKVTKRKFIGLIVKTEVYSIYHQNIEFCNQLEEDDNLLLDLYSSLGVRGYDYTSAILLKKIKKIKEISQDALRCAYNGAYVWFFDN